MELSLFTLVLNDRPVEDAISLLGKIGYKGVELQGCAPHLPVETSLERAKEIRKCVDDAGMVVSNLATYTGNYSTLSDEDCNKELDILKKYMELGNILGCKMIRHEPGGPSSRVAEPKHYERASKWMQKAADIAAQGDFRLVMELHHGGLTETADDALKILKMIDRENVGVIHDAGNMYIAMTNYGRVSVKKLGKYIFHVHVKDELLVPKGSDPDSFEYEGRCYSHKLLNHGGVDHNPAFAALREIGYDGFLSMECHVPHIDPEMIARHEFITMQEMLAK